MFPADGAACVSDSSCLRVSHGQHLVTQPPEENSHNPCLLSPGQKGLSGGPWWLRSVVGAGGPTASVLRSPAVFRMPELLIFMPFQISAGNQSSL